MLRAHAPIAFASQMGIRERGGRYSPKYRPRRQMAQILIRPRRLRHLEGRMSGVPRSPRCPSRRDQLSWSEVGPLNPESFGHGRSSTESNRGYWSPTECFMPIRPNHAHEKGPPQLDGPCYVCSLPTWLTNRTSYRRPPAGPIGQQDPRRRRSPCPRPCSTSRSAHCSWQAVRLGQ
jgi:hypothetical protein